MEFYQLIYLISAGLLWICILINIWQLRRNRRLSKDYLEAITAAKKARDNYEQLCQNLNEEQNYFRNLREQEEAHEEES